MDDIARSWRFRQIIPCHFDAPVAAGPAEFRAAFTWAFEAAGMAPPAAPLLDRLSNLLTFGRGPPAAPKVIAELQCSATRGSPKCRSRVRQRWQMARLVAIATGMALRCCGQVQWQCPSGLLLCL